MLACEQPHGQYDGEEQQHDGGNTLLDVTRPTQYPVDDGGIAGRRSRRLFGGWLFAAWGARRGCLGVLVRAGFSGSFPFGFGGSFHARCIVDLLPALRSLSLAAGFRPRRPVRGCMFSWHGMIRAGCPPSSIYRRQSVMLAGSAI